MAMPHVVVFPYDEQGHVIPAFALGRALASRGIRATGVLTATRFAKSNVTFGKSTTLFQVVTIPDDDDARRHDDNSNGDAHHVWFQHSLQWLKPGLMQLLLGLDPPPSCLISDILYPWSQDVADHLGLPRFQFCPCPAVSYLTLVHFQSFLDKRLLPLQPGMEDEVIDFVPGLAKGFRLGDIPCDALHRDATELEVWARMQACTKRGAGVVINTVHELETDAINGLCEEGISVFPVGPMGNIDWAGNIVRTPSIFSEDEECLMWLDSKPPRSVVYAAFGSLVSLTDQEIQEVALGLVACGQPFLWALRSTSALPRSFFERMKEKGRVIVWAPQTAVLSHPSVGCFLSHCGMGSVLDALWAGMPIIACFYKISDHTTVFRLITEDWKVALPIHDRRAAREGQVPPLQQAIETCVRELLHGERGLEVRRNVEKVKGVMRKAVEAGGCSNREIDKLANTIVVSASGK